MQLDHLAAQQAALRALPLRAWLATPLATELVSSSLYVCSPTSPAAPSSAGEKLLLEAVWTPRRFRTTQLKVYDLHLPRISFPNRLSVEHRSMPTQ